jgi:hypothetical protein
MSSTPNLACGEESHGPDDEDLYCDEQEDLKADGILYTEDVQALPVVQVFALVCEVTSRSVA